MKRAELAELDDCLPIRDAGIWTCFGYGSSLTGITLTSSRSLCFPAVESATLLVLDD